MEDAPTPIAELDHGPSKFEEFLEKNQKILIIAATLIFLGVLAYVFFTGKEKKDAVEAGSDFMQATDENSLNQVITDHSNKATAGTAAMAIAQLRTTDDDRTAALNHFIDNYPDHPGIPSKLLELALIQMNTGNNSDAETTLNKLISNEQSAYLIPRAKIALADIASSNNQLEKAEQIYTEIKDSQNLHFANVAAERLLYLNAKEPIITKKNPTPSVPKTEKAGTPLPSNESPTVTPNSPTPVTQDKP